MKRPSGCGPVVGRNLARIRRERGETQAEMAHHLRSRGVDWSRPCLAAYESGLRDGINAGTLLAIAAALEVRVGELHPGFADLA